MLGLGLRLMVLPVPPCALCAAPVLGPLLWVPRCPACVLLVRLVLGLQMLEQHRLAHVALVVRVPGLLQVHLRAHYVQAEHIPQQLEQFPPQHVSTAMLDHSHHQAHQCVLIIAQLALG